MATPDADLGINASFDEQAFRNAITFAMQMGAPPDVAKRATFVLPATTKKRYFKDGVLLAEPPRMDRDGKPLDPSVSVKEEAAPTKQVNCAIEIQTAEADELPIGNFRPTKAVVTLLDTEYADIKGAVEMSYSGDRYLFGYEPELNGLFDVGIHTLVFYALDES